MDADVAFAILRTSFGKRVDHLVSKINLNIITIYGMHHSLLCFDGVLGISDYGSTHLISGLIMLFGVAILEIPTIYVINRWAPWLLERKMLGEN